MKKLLLTTSIVVVGMASSAQTLDRSVTASGGGEMGNSTTTLEFTIGETVVGDFTGTTNVLTNGFNQGLKDPGVSIPTLGIAKLKVYPNPAMDQLNVFSEENVSVQIVDFLGKEIQSNVEISAETEEQILVSELPAGMYFLKIIREDQSVNMIKWVKS